MNRIIAGLVAVVVMAASAGRVAAQEAAAPAAEQPPTAAVPQAGAGQAQQKTPLEYWTDLGNAEMQAVRYDEAVRAFEEALGYDPKSKEARFGLGTVYIQQEKFREALELLAPMTDEFPGDYFLKNNVAWLYATAKDHSVRNGIRAVALAQDALLLAPRDFHVWSTLAEAYYVSGQYEKALRTAEEALNLGTENNAGPGNVREYQAQVEKCRRAVEALSLVE